MVSLEELSALAQVVFVDLVLAGDNAIVVGMAVAGLPAAVRPKIIFFGIVAATVMRVLFALVTVQLLQIVGLVLAGGLLLLWVSWRLWREIEEQRKLRRHDAAGEHVEPEPPKTKTVNQAIVQIVVADLSMSLWRPGLATTTVPSRVTPRSK